MDVIFKENNIFYNVLCVLITENEKLFDRSDTRLYWTTVFHMMAIFHHVYVVNFARAINLESDFDEIKNLKTFRLAYLTGWNFTFQMTFLWLALFHDVLQWVDKQGTVIGKQVKYIRDIVFNGCVAPYTCFVSTMFWALYAIDRELVFPKVYDEILPWWLNHCVHTNIIVVVAIETLLQSRRYPTDKKIETICYVFISVFYAIVYYSIYFFAHVWLYGVFGVMTWWQVCLYQLLIWASAYVFYNMVFMINRMIHGADSLEEICAKEENIVGFPKVQDLKQFGNINGVGVESELVKTGFAQIDSKEGNDIRAGDVAEVKENGRISDDDITKMNGHSQNDIEENGRDWKSFEVNAEELDNNGPSKTFDKSWSTKYKKYRNEVENSSL